MLILGLSAFYHDSACALIENGEIICAVQEERFSRKKHDPSFPFHSLKFCLDKICEKSKEDLSYQSAIQKIDYIAYYDKPFLTFERLLETYLNHAPFKGFKSFQQSMPLFLGSKLNMSSHIKKQIKKHFKAPKKSVPKILFNYHHLSHASSAFYPSPYKSAGVLCLDGVGEWASTSAWIGKDNKIKPLWQIDFPHSLGLFYSAFTEYCGFKVNSGEYKLMGLAPYGEPKFTSLLKEEVIEIKEDGSFQLNMKYFDYPHSYQMAGPALASLLNKPPRSKGDKNIDPLYIDVASSVQAITEEIVIKLSQSLYKETQIKNLCLAGGVALNCVANRKILNKTSFESLWIQPAAGDAGGSLGSAYSVYYDFLNQERKAQQPDSMKGSLLGPDFSTKEVEDMLKQEKAFYKKYEESDLIKETVTALTENKVIGWFQGAMEFGPRALGARSILGSAQSPDMQKKMNQKIKFRESFRPFAMSLLKEQVSDFFEEIDSPYMLLVSHIISQKRQNESAVQKAKALDKQSIPRSPVPSCTHVDYSCRIQTVGPSAHPRFRKLLLAFYKKTNCPGIINTSFNVRGEPIVCSPYSAYRCFMNTDMDICIINDFILKKEEQKAGFKDFYVKNLEKD